MERFDPMCRMVHKQKLPLPFEGYKTFMEIQYRPELPSHNYRYRRGQVTPRLVGETMPAGWRQWVHPEGDTYFTNAEMNVVTGNDPREASILAVLIESQDHLRKKGISVGMARCAHSELCLDVTLGQGPDPTVVQYYFVDLLLKRLRWFHPFPANFVGNWQVDESERQSCLLHDFWLHIEHYPMHLPVRWKDEEALIAILQHGCIDNMTSPGSNFPFTAAQCKDYLGILESGKLSQLFSSTPSVSSSLISLASGYRNATMARIWKVVARSRHINRHGLMNPRLDRTEGLTAFSNAQTQSNIGHSFGNLGQSAGILTR